MTEVEDRAGKLTALWDGYVKPLADPELYEADRVAAAFAVMRACCEMRNESADPDMKLELLAKATMCLQFISADLFGSSSDLYNGDFAAGDLEERRRAMIAVNMAERSINPWLREAADPSVVLMPLSTVRALGQGFEALNAGEVQSLFKPADSGRHGAAWSLDQMKMRAVQHVLYLNGQGVTKRIARQRVANAIKASPETLRKWEERDLGDPFGSFRAALAAGQLAADPSSLTADKPVAGPVADAYESLRTETLDAFGGRFREVEASGGN